MKSRIFMLSSVGFLLLAPVVQQNIYGIETSTMVQDSKIMTDEQLNKAVKDSILADVKLAKFVDKIRITVDKGVVTLSGVVDSSDVKSNIESKAKAVMGVKKVVNNIEVKEISK